MSRRPGSRDLLGRLTYVRGQTSTIYAAGTCGYHTYRIPAVVAVRDGTVLAFAEGRRAGRGDAGPIDLVLRRSHDGGVTWGRLQVVSTDGEHTVGNPSPVVDPRSGDVVLLSVRTAGTATEALILRGDVAPEDSRRVWLQRGVDHGARWTRPTDITEQVKRPGWRWYATGPGHAIALRHGAHTGRLVVPANHSVPGDARTGRYGGHLLLSDDGGRSFCIGAEAAPGAGGVHANETAVAELSDGRIYLNTRDQGARPGTPTRAHTWSSSAGETLDVPYTSVRDLHGPVVQNSVLAVAGRLLVAGPSAPGARQRLAVRTSADAGRSFPQEQVVWAGPAAYSDLVDLGDGVVGVAFEHGRDGPYERIGFTRLRLA